MFANLVREGSWVDARIDRARPDRKPLPKPDIRRMLIPIGPVAVFGGEQLPIGVLGCRRRHGIGARGRMSRRRRKRTRRIRQRPNSPLRAVIDAIKAAGMPPGIFSLIHSTRNEIARALVQHPHIKAVGFTGSLRAGRALFDAAASRPDPIPVYAEMGSVNPVFLLPGALAERAEAIAEGLEELSHAGRGTVLHESRVDDRHRRRRVRSIRTTHRSS